MTRLCRKRQKAVFTHTAKDKCTYQNRDMCNHINKYLFMWLHISLFLYVHLSFDVWVNTAFWRFLHNLVIVLWYPEMKGSITWTVRSIRICWCHYHTLSHGEKTSAIDPGHQSVRAISLLDAHLDESRYLHAVTSRQQSHHINQEVRLRLHQCWKKMVAQNWSNIRSASCFVGITANRGNRHPSFVQYWYKIRDLNGRNTKTWT